VIDLAASLRLVTAALDDLGIPHAVVGSTAAAAWGVVRMTRDVDIVVMAAVESGEALVDALLLDPELYVPEDEGRRAVRGGGTFNVLHPASGGKVDVFVRPTTDAFTRSRLERRVRSAVLGIDCWVATPEDVVLAKLRWRLTSRSEVQWRDCVEIAATQRLDGEYLREWAEPLGVAADLAELLADTALG
jgi:hypothetical protein